MRFGKQHKRDYDTKLQLRHDLYAISPPDVDDTRATTLGCRYTRHRGFAGFRGD